MHHHSLGPIIVPSRPNDINQRAKMVVDIATGETSNEPEKTSGKVRSGKARAKALTAERRSEIARQAAQARWS